MPTDRSHAMDHVVVVLFENRVRGRQDLRGWGRKDLSNRSPSRPSATAYGVGRVTTKHRSTRDIRILVFGLAMSALLTFVLVGPHRQGDGRRCRHTVESRPLGTHREGRGQVVVGGHRCRRRSRSARRRRAEARGTRRRHFVVGPADDPAERRRSAVIAQPVRRPPTKVAAIRGL